MYTSVVFLLCLGSSTWTLPHHADVCQKGIHYWCHNEWTATECGVLEFCKAQYPDFIKNTLKDAEPIKIDLYYEAFCGGCRKFILEQLYPTFQKLYSTGIFEIALYPYGNAHEKKVGQKWEFECQHGSEECQMNLVETCALHLLNHPQQFMPYIQCVENKPSIINAKKCADDLHIEWGPISACYNGSEGNYLEHVMAQKTDALVPRHQYVPWIVVDGKHTEKMQDDAQDLLAEFLCDNYKGTKPKECHDIQKKKQRCFKENNA